MQNDIVEKLPTWRDVLAVEWVRQATEKEVQCNPIQYIYYLAI